MKMLENAMKMFDNAKAERDRLEPPQNRLLVLNNAPKFDESSFVSRLAAEHFDYVKPPHFDEMLRTILRCMNAKAERGIVFVVCTGPMGVGKTRAGLELLKTAQQRHKEWRCGYISSAALLPFQENEMALSDLDKCFQLLACALFTAFLPNESLSGYTFNLVAILDKLKRDLSGSILLQIDEFSHNPIAVRMIMRASSHARVATGSNQASIVVVATGVQSLVSVTALLEGSRYGVTSFSLSPLNEIDLGEQIRQSFMRRIKMTDRSVFDRAARLQNLIIDCGGFPASFDYLADLVLRLDEFQLDALRSRGYLDVSQAKDLYDSILQDVGVRYSESRWKDILLEPEFDKRIGILSRIVLDVVTAAGVRQDVAISPQHDAAITYKIVEAGGLISLKHKHDDVYEVNMPMLAVSCVNEILRVMDGDVLKNPFDYGFEIHEEMALVSFQARLRHLIAAHVETCKLDELRPGALLAGNSLNQLIIDVPDSCDLYSVWKLFENSTGEADVDLRTGLRADGPAPPQKPGTLLMAAVGQKAVDGALLLQGKWKGKRCRILVLSRSKWSQLLNPRSEGESITKIQEHSVNNIVNALAKLKDAVIRAWLGSTKQPIFVIYDVFSDHRQGESLKISDIHLPHTNCAVSVTTEESIQDVVGPVLGARARLKRIIEDEHATNRPNKRLKACV